MAWQNKKRCEVEGEGEGEEHFLLSRVRVYIWRFHLPRSGTINAEVDRNHYHNRSHQKKTNKKARRPQG